MSGLNLVILPRPGGSAPEWMSSWGSGTAIFSPVLFMVALATAGWLIFSTTAFYGHLRLMDLDERAAYTSGVRIGVVRLGAHAVAGIFAGLASLAFTALIGSGDPTQGTTYTLISATALVLGGTSLAGGRATVMDSLLGALNLFPHRRCACPFNFGSVQGFVTDLLLRCSSRYLAFADTCAAAPPALAQVHFSIHGVCRTRPLIRWCCTACDLRLCEFGTAITSCEFRCRHGGDGAARPFSVRKRR